MIYTQLCRSKYGGIWGKPQLGKRREVGTSGEGKALKGPSPKVRDHRVRERGSMSMIEHPTLAEGTSRILNQHGWLCSCVLPTTQLQGAPYTVLLNGKAI